MVDFLSDAIRKHVISQCIVQYGALPKHVDGDPELRDAFKAELVRQAFNAVPFAWRNDPDKCRIFAQRLWDQIVIKNRYQARWPDAGIVARCALEVVADMTRHDPPKPQVADTSHQIAGPKAEPIMGLTEDFPAFYRRMYHQHSGHLFDMDNPRGDALRGMLETAKERYVEKFGHWPAN